MPNFRPVYLRSSDPRSIFWDKNFRRVEFAPGEVYDWSTTMSQLYDLIDRMDNLETDLATFLSSYRASTLLNGSTPTAVASKTWTGTLAGGIVPVDVVNQAHGIADVTKIQHVFVAIKSSVDGKYKGIVAGVNTSANVGFHADYDGTNISISKVQSAHQGQPYVIVCDYMEA